MATSKATEKEEKDTKATKAAEEEGEQERGPSGPTSSPVENYVEPVAVEAELLAEAGEPQANPNTIDDGVEDVELGPPVVGAFVQITEGDYAGRFAAYLGNVSLTKDGDIDVIQVRTRDADNLVLDVPYSDVSSTTYSGGR